MKNIYFRFCDFADNLIKQVIRKEDAERTVFVFPTAASKKRAIREFQQQWNFSRTRFYTMEEFKELLFCPGMPVLREDKRTLAFYAALTDEDKSFFKINNYFQSIELATEFFNLWEEFNEELVNENAVQPELFSQNDSELIDWQWNTFRRMLAIKQQFLDFIKSKKFIDRIFIYKPELLDLSSFDDFENFIFVNQFYYTNLEKHIIKTLADRRKNVTIYYQLPEQYINKETLDVSPFALADVMPEAQPRIHIAECANAFTMFISLLKKLHQYRQEKPEQRQYVVDVSFLEKHYAGFLDHGQFQFTTGMDFSHAAIYKFLTTLLDILNNAIYEPQQEKILIPIDRLLDAVLTEPFFQYFHPGEDAAEISEIQERLLDYLYSLIEYDNKYFDLDGQFFAGHSQREEIQEITSILNFVQRFMEIDSIKSFVDFIDAEGGIDVARLITTRENDFSNLRDTFYRHLSIFNSIVEFDIVSDWEHYFNVRLPELRTLKIAAGILQLFIDYLKFKKYQYNYDVKNENLIRVTELLDTRNINYENVFVMNVIERELPHAQQTPFLFTEKQRRLLNLKTYEDIKFREKYYFLRLILGSGNVFIFTQHNIENNIEVSSFVEEIKLCYNIKPEKIEDQNYGGIFRRILSGTDYSVAGKAITGNEFFSIPLDTRRDFPHGNLNITQYALKSLRENPFAYYVQHHANAGERTKEIDTDFSGKLIGNIVHDIINECWRSLEEISAVPLFGYDFANIDEHYVNTAIDKILNRQSLFYYRLPHNHTVVYFDEILLPVIRQGVLDFFKFLHELGLSNKKLNMIPEKEQLTPAERKYKTVIRAEENDAGLAVRLRGRADLRLEIPEENRYFIFDYKTGRFDIEQLVIYELFYYLLEHPEWIDEVDSYFYNVLKFEVESLRRTRRFKSQKINVKSDIFEIFKQDIREIISRLSENGFSLPDQKSFLRLMPEITRSDLFLAAKKTVAKNEVSDIE